MLLELFNDPLATTTHMLAVFSLQTHLPIFFFDEKNGIIVSTSITRGSNHSTADHCASFQIWISTTIKHKLSPSTPGMVVQTLNSGSPALSQGLAVDGSSIPAATPTTNRVSAVALRLFSRRSTNDNKSRG